MGWDGGVCNEQMKLLMVCQISSVCNNGKTVQKYLWNSSRKVIRPNAIEPGTVGTTPLRAGRSRFAMYTMPVHRSRCT